MAKSGKQKSFESTVTEFLDRFNIVTGKDLDELKKSIGALNKKIDRAIGTKQRKSSQRTKQSKKRTAGKKREPKGKLGERVVQAMGSNGEFTFQNIKDKTGMNESQLRNIIFKLSRENIIKKPRRGIYSLHTQIDDNGREAGRTGALFLFFFSTGYKVSAFIVITYNNATLAKLGFGNPDEIPLASNAWLVDKTKTVPVGYLHDPDLFGLLFDTCKAIGQLQLAF